MANEPHPLLLCPDMRAINDKFRTGFTKYYVAMGRRSNGVIMPVMDESRFQQALRDAGVSGPGDLENILNLKRTTCSQIWNCPNKNMTGEHYLRLRYWATAKMHPMREEPTEEIDPGPFEALLDTLRGGKGEAAFSRETVVEYRLRCFAEYFRLLEPRQTALLMTVCCEMLGDQGVPSDGRESALDIISRSVSTFDGELIRALFVITDRIASTSDDHRPVTELDQEYESECSLHLDQGELDAEDMGINLKTLGASEAMLRRYGESRIRDSLKRTNYGGSADLLDLAELVAAPNYTLYWALNNAEPNEDEESRMAPLTTSRPPSWAPFDVLRQYVGQ